MPIHRIVKMTFLPEKVNDFLDVFEFSKEKIRNRSGCLSLQLIQDPLKPNVLFTSSIWESESDLESYRDSELFIENRLTYTNSNVFFLFSHSGYVGGVTLIFENIALPWKIN